MKLEDYTHMPKETLERLVWEKKARLQELRFTRQIGKVKNSAEFSRVRKDIARLMTRLHMLAKKNVS